MFVLPSHPEPQENACAGALARAGLLIASDPIKRHR
jgi:hypothetical protein